MPQTYRRGKVEWALWQAQNVGHAPEKIPQAFKTRVKRLLDLDRKLPIYEAQTEPQGHAFIDYEPEGKGAESEFREENAFGLMVGLDLLDAGYKQGDVVFTLQQFRTDVDRWYGKIIRSSKTEQILPPMYVMFGRMEILEVYDQIQGERVNHPFLRRPIFCKGKEQLMIALDSLLHTTSRSRLVLEVGQKAVALREALSDAPEIRRGRPAG